MDVILTTTFDNEFDLTERSLDELIIKETNQQDNCYIWDKENNYLIYNSFILAKNSQSKTVCQINFYRSSQTNKYLPRPVFIRKAHNGDIRITRSQDKVTIKFDDSDSAIKFWELINFLNSYKDLVDVGEFSDSYKVLAKDTYIVEFQDKDQAQQVADIIQFVDIANLSSSDLKSITFEHRKKGLRTFYYLLKNIEYEGISSRELYREKFEIRNGEEYIWHHFFKQNEWILGLNIDARFVMEFIDEAHVGVEDTAGRKSPIVDVLGVTDFTTLIELKHSSTKIFKQTKSRGRANTWDFTLDFVEGISQCLGQKFELDKYFDIKEIIKEDGSRLDKSEIQSIDPKSVFIVGNKKDEFPIDELNDINLLKNKTLERFRRNIRNVDVLTFDELFERAYQVVFTEKLQTDWYKMAGEEIFK